ncbi:MAG TPA: hypothetical protein VGJ86_15975 [Acidimicrobiales bacterium]|jgi:hypothetical protein
MTHDDNLSALLERAAGPEPGMGDSGDVRRRARRYTRRRRAGLTVGVVALVLPALFAAGKLQSNDHEPAVLASDSTTVVPGDLLFERALADGTTMRVSTTDDRNQVAVELSGVDGAQAIPIQAGVITGRAGTEAWPWDVAAMVPCPGNESVWLHLWPDYDLIGDEMAMADGLAVVAVPRDPAAIVDDVPGFEDLVEGEVPGQDADTTQAPSTERFSVSGTEGGGAVSYVDFTDGTDHKFRPGTMIFAGDELHAATGWVEDVPAGLIPEPRDPGNPCAG